MNWLVLYSVYTILEISKKVFLFILSVVSIMPLLDFVWQIANKLMFLNDPRWFSEWEGD